jgi:3-phosphoshikimate 1-carboxyvinyltransferase
MVVKPIKKISGEVRLPGSKSLSNRILLLASLADGSTVVENILVRVYSPGTLSHTSPELLE